MALAGVEPLLCELRRTPENFKNGIYVYGLLVLAFELRYTFFRGEIVVFRALICIYLLLAS